MWATSLSSSRVGQRGHRRVRWLMQIFNGTFNGFNMTES
ncbi:predicted protein [Botrytis cinerea T4]|uniref:Uncharacterized protein n=1 Tax=Botryotinia fuckeliana (strain T4) TaxID=999810 RepID=G2YR79_BOTF4|nr:predicted protein [Botrytis cinerea T4]